MLKDGLFVYDGMVEEWGVIIGNKIIYNGYGFELINDDSFLEGITKVVECDYGFDAIKDHGKVIFERK